MTAPQLNIDKTACVRARLLQASCVACQQICPVAAIDLTARAPVVDAQACTLCGACTAVCPEAVFALSVPMPPAQGPSHFIACRCHPSVTDPQSIPCIHSIGLDDLAQMWLSGMRRLVVATDSCVVCVAAPMVWIETTVADFNRLAECRGLEGIELVSASGDEVKNRQGKQEQPDASRRAFLRRFIASEPAAQIPDALQQFLAQGHQTAPANTLYPFSPHIDPATCLGCDDCVNICPHDALTLIKAENGKSLYHCAPEHCTGCQLCSDICDVHAIEVQGMGRRGADILLNQFQCRACGVQSHSTLAHPPTDGLCRICQHTDHHKKLFVVLD